MNNGAIPLSHREARKALRAGNEKTTKAFQQAKDHGFLIERFKASFDWKVGAGQGRASEWEITTEPYGETPARRLYREWKNETAVPDTGANGTQHRNRSNKSTPDNDANGSKSRNRFARFDGGSGS